MRTPFDFTLKDEYKLAKAQGDKRFGSECKHEVVKHGHCVNCLRRVMTKAQVRGIK